jgi:hypothetical protein
MREKRRGGFNTVNIRSKKLWAGTLATGAFAALSLTVITTSAPADSAKQGPVSEIRMILDGGPAFDGPGSIPGGTDLRIVNETNPNQIGPHSFTLIEEGDRPANKDEYKKCGKLQLRVCENVAEAHHVSKTFEVKKPNVDKGLEGWDKSFSKESKGDSWFTFKKNESETRTVSAAPGPLYYFCIVHPKEMQGQITVESR